MLRMHRSPTGLRSAPVGLLQQSCWLLLWLPNVTDLSRANLRGRMSCMKDLLMPLDAVFKEPSGFSQRTAQL